jgi:hypothetical protein
MTTSKSMSRAFSNNANTAARSTSSSAKKSRSSTSTSAHKIKSELIGGRKYTTLVKYYYSCEIPTAAKKNQHEDGQAAKIKKLQGKFSHWSSSIVTLTLWTAENDALRKAASAKENVKEEEKISRPAKGVAGNGFRLQAAMLLQDNKPLYAALRVSP